MVLRARLTAAAGPSWIYCSRTKGARSEATANPRFPRFPPAPTKPREVHPRNQGAASPSTRPRPPCPPPSLQSRLPSPTPPPPPPPPFPSLLRHRPSSPLMPAIATSTPPLRLFPRVLLLARALAEHLHLEVLLLVEATRARRRDGIDHLLGHRGRGGGRARGGGGGGVSGVADSCGWLGGGAAGSSAVGRARLGGGAAGSSAVGRARQLRVPRSLVLGPRRPRVL